MTVRGWVETVATQGRCDRVGAACQQARECVGAAGIGGDGGNAVCRRWRQPAGGVAIDDSARNVVARQVDMVARRAAGAADSDLPDIFCPGKAAELAGDGIDAHPLRPCWIEIDPANARTPRIAGKVSRPPPD